MASFLDACIFNATSTGTGDFVVASAFTGYQTPAQANAVNGQVYRYRAQVADLSQWEVGFGIYTSGTVTLARTTVIFNSSGGTSKISFTTPPQVFITLLAEDILSPAALKADQVAASSVIVPVVPAVQQFHPSAAKAWGYFTQTGGIYTNAASYGVASFTKNATGDITITFSTAFTSSNFACIASTASSSVLIASINRTANTIELILAAATTGVSADIAFSFVCFGTQ